MAKKVVLLGMALMLVLAPIGCGSDSEDNKKDDGVVTVYAESSDASASDSFGPKSAAATDVAGLTALNITFASLDLRRTDGSSVTVIDDSSDVNTVDLVAALNDPTLLASFNVPPGDYNGIQSGVIDVVEITDADGETCPVAEDFTFGPIVSPTTVTVDDGGNVAIDVEFPVLTGDCENGVGTVGFGEVEVRPHGVT